MARAERHRSARRLQSDSHALDRKSTRLNSSHLGISYAVFCLKSAAATNLYALSLHAALPILGATIGSLPSRHLISCESRVPGSRRYSGSACSSLLMPMSG